jgi:acyl carrier protein
VDRTPLTTTPRSSLEAAILRRLSRLHDGEIADLDEVDCHASFFVPTGFQLGGQVLDSLDIVEMVVALEVDFNISIVDTYDVVRFDSIAKLSLLLEETVAPAMRAEFEGKWSSGKEVSDQISP